nr:MAG TPA: hemolysin [Caudoviricetes sp.]
MIESIIVGVLSLTGTIIGSFGGMRLMSYRIEQLEKKVDKHNNFAERMPVVEQRMKVCEHRIDDLEDAEKENRRLEHEN